MNNACEKRCEAPAPGASSGRSTKASALAHDRDLAEGGVGEHPLDVALGEGEQRGPDHRQRGAARARTIRAVSESGEEREEARDDVGPGGHHRRRVDEGRRRASGPPWRRGASRGTAAEAGLAGDAAQQAEQRRPCAAPCSAPRPPTERRAAPRRSSARSRPGWRWSGRRRPGSTSPRTNARSAVRVTRNALTAARRAASRRLSWPMSRKEHQPMTSQPTRVRIEVAGLDDEQHRREEQRDGGGEHAGAGVAPQVPAAERPGRRARPARRRRRRRADSGSATRCSGTARPPSGSGGRVGHDAGRGPALHRDHLAQRWRAGSGTAPAVARPPWPAVAGGRRRAPAPR